MSWTAPANSGGLPLTDYVVRYYDYGNAGWREFADGVSTATSVTVTGLTNGYTTEVQVAAKNSSGLLSGYTSSTTGVPCTVPSAPATLSPTLPGCSVGAQTQACSGTVNLSWSAPASNGGSAVTGYRVQYRPADDPNAWTVFGSTVTTTNVTVTGLTNGTAYVFRVAASNAAGQGPFTADSGQIVPRTTPGAPTNVALASVGNGTASITWTAPDSDGGNAVTTVAATSSALYRFRKTGDGTFTVYKVA